MKKIVLFVAFVATLFALVIFSGIWGSTISMDTTGYVFLLFASISQAVLFALPILLVATLFHFLRLPKVVSLLSIALSSATMLFLLVDRQVFALYRFHINGFVLSMLTGPGAGQIFVFNWLLYLKVVLIFLTVVWLIVGLWYMCKIFSGRSKLHFLYPAFISVFLVSTLACHLMHAYASYVSYPSIVKSARIVPYLWPLTARHLMERLGVSRPDHIDIATVSGDVRYPLSPIQTVRPDSLPNIVMLFVDSWSKRTFTSECMPSVYNYALHNSLYADHRSCSNGTRSSIFTTFFSVPDIYWKDFHATHTSPVFIDALLDYDYDMKFYTSAGLDNPPFSQVIFFRVPNLRTYTDGEHVWQRDKKIAEDFVADLPNLAASGRPFFSFLFFDLAHSPELSAEVEERFTPSWKFPDYSVLNNDTDPTEFFNLYRNCCYFVDGQISKVLSELDRLHLSDNTIVIISGDHAQEFNENHKNFWGHAGNYTKWQIGVPMIVHYPGQNVAHTYHHRTSHFDIVPTILKDYLGVVNRTEDYSLGFPLDSLADRGWHIAGSEINFAFITESDTIMEKMHDESVSVTDGNLNDIENFSLDPVKFNQTINKMNRYYTAEK